MSHTISQSRGSPCQISLFGQAGMEPSPAHGSGKKRYFDSEYKPIHQVTLMSYQVGSNVPNLENL